MRSLRKTIRVKKEDSAFVYSILESYEGIASYSTLNYQLGDAHRDLELRIPRDFVSQVNAVIEQLGDIVYEIEPSFG